MQPSSLPPGASEQIAEEALAASVRRRCRGASWQGLARELAWRAVTGGARDPRRIDALAESAEAMLAARIDQALWAVEKTAIDSFEEFAGGRGGEEAALAAARLDAQEEADRLVEDAYGGVLDALLESSRRAA